MTELGVPRKKGAKPRDESDEPPTAGGDPAEPTVDSVVQESEGYVHAVAEAIADLASRGFRAQLEVSDDAVNCLACRSRCDPADVAWMQHVEVTCPSGDRSAFVCGMRCPICGTRGTAIATAAQWMHRRTRRGR